MKQKLKGILSLTAIIVLTLIVVVAKWKELLAGLGMTVLAGIAIVLFGVIAVFIGVGISGDKWDKD